VTAKALKKSSPPPKKAFGKLAAALARSPEALIPPAFQILWTVIRFIVLYGGRASGKSWSIARVLLLMASETPLRILCCREIQGSIKESAYRLLADMIVELGLEDFYTVGADSITGKNGSRFYFEGLRYNASKIRSYEGVDVVWVEEAQNVSDQSFEVLLPTIRKKGSRFFISFNPMTRDDPVLKRFVESARPDVLAKRVGWRDNPFLSPEAIAEKDWLQRTDPDSYLHVWEGEPREFSDALILKGKYFSESFEVDPRWSGPHHGCDFGFAQDPNFGVRCYIDDDERVLYVSHEFHALGMDIDALPAALQAAIPGIDRYTVHCDSARPETVSYLARHGIPRAVSAEKWPGSIDDGIAYLRSFARIVVDPSCKHLLDECGRYSFKTDRLTSAILPEPEDRHNHGIDALRYSLSPLIRNQPTGGYFSRAALLSSGEPLEPGALIIDKVFLTLTCCDAPGTAVGVITWGYALYTERNTRIVVLDYDLVEMHEAQTGDWLMKILERAHELRAEWKALDHTTLIHVEERTLYDRLVSVLVEEVVPHDPVVAGGGPALYNVRKTEAYEVRTADRKELTTIDDRAADIRALINGGKFAKLARSAYTRQATHRSTDANHLTAQLLGFRPGVKDAAQELVAAFLLGCFLAREPT
jgi:phage terminase large subunit